MDKCEQPDVKGWYFSRNAINDMPKGTHFFKITTLIFLPFSLSLFAQQPATPLTSTEKKLVIDVISRKLADIYIYPDAAKKMISVLSTKYK